MRFGPLRTGRLLITTSFKISQIEREFPSYRQIRIIEAIARHRGIGQAAEMLHMSQPAVTRALQNAEELLGVKLFDRTPNGVLPTVFVEPILRHAQSIDAAFRETEREIEALHRIDEKPLVIGGGPHSVEIYGYPAAAAMILNDRSMRISIMQYSVCDLVSQLRLGAVDIGVSEIGLIENFTDLKIEVMATLPVHFVCSATHSLAQDKDVTLSRVTEFPLAGNLISPQIARFLGPNFGRLGEIDVATGALEPAIPVQALGAIKEMVLSSDAVALMTRASIESEVDAGRIILLDHAIAPALFARMAVVSMASRAATPSMRAFRNAVFAIAERQMAAM